MSAATLVIGAGRNGLAAAILCARAGRRVVVLEAGAAVGGQAAPREFHPGFRVPGLWHADARPTPALRDVVSAAERAEPALFVPELEGPGLWLARDPERAAVALAARSPRLAAAFASWRAFVLRIAPFVHRICDEFPPALDPQGARGLVELARTGLAFRRLGRRDLEELLRVAPSSADDWLRSALGDDAAAAALAFSGLFGTGYGPRAPWSAGALLLAEATAGPARAGGPAALAAELERAARGAGVEIRTQAEVVQIEVARGRARGAVLADGTALAAEAVIATCDPRTALSELVSARELPEGVVRALERWRARGASAKVHLALEGPLSFAGARGEVCEAARLAEGLAGLERASDAFKYGELSERLALDVRVPSLSSPELAPPGTCAVSISVHAVPRALRGGWDDAARTRLGERVTAELERWAPGTQRRILACEVLTPADLEREYRLRGGHPFHGETGFDQLFSLRPAHGLSRAATPIAGLYLGGSGSHPGPYTVGGAGALAARALALASARA